MLQCIKVYEDKKGVFLKLTMGSQVFQRVLSSNHHKNVLAEMLKFARSEQLTDVTFLCKDSKPVFAHRKVLFSVSKLIRTLGRLNEERLTIVLDVSLHRNVIDLNWPFYQAMLALTSL